MNSGLTVTTESPPQERDDRQTAKVTREPPNNATTTPDASRVRRLAEWVIRNGGNVDFRGQSHGDRPVGKEGNLPDGPFTIFGIALNGSEEKLDDDKLLQLLQDCPPGMTVLGIANAGVSDAGVKKALQLPCFDGLTSLTLAAVPVTDDVMSSVLAHKSSLTRLGIGRTNIRTEGWKRMREFERSRLEVLTISNDEFGNDDLKVIGGLKQLVQLYMSVVPITDAGLEHLRGMQHLQHLGLGYTDITDAGLEHLRGLTQLRVLALNHTRVTADGMRRLRESLPSCKVIPEVPDAPAGRKGP
jgi:hypothetical protein